MVRVINNLKTDFQTTDIPLPDGKQESLANAKVNVRQHCVSLSCLGDEDSENIASERYVNTLNAKKHVCQVGCIFADLHIYSFNMQKIRKSAS